MLILRRLFGTTAFRHNQAAASKPMAPLAGALRKVHQEEEELLEEEEVKGPRIYKSFEPYSFIRPWDLSLAGKKLTPPRHPRKPAIPPRTRDAREKDVFYNLGIDPLKLSLHPQVISAFLSEMAMIQPRRVTQLTSKSQRRVAKAIKRAKMMGVIPLHSRYVGT
uniref:Small ribosomal subunit protein bS18m n=1 Tax=Mycena chlorophos TaxID=658473 RepID=A0ABQ0M9A2_MYCCL|nr:mitochondrial ribosomal protein s18 [Mycena chlorophos]